MKILYSTLVLLTLISNPVVGQNKSDFDPDLNPEQQEVLAVIIELFDGYREGDSSRVRAVFTEDAVLRRATEKEGKPFLSGGSIDGFVKYVGSGLDKIHDEPIWDYSVHVNDRLASVWTKYAFYLDGKFHHCGEETFQLFKTENGWKIFLLADTSRTENCEIPEEIRLKSEK